jgi:hypothetical protein
LEEQPYFARVVTDEITEEGAEKEVEFRLGTASFPAQRIIDWRKAPISKLYYDYKGRRRFLGEHSRAATAKASSSCAGSITARQNVLNLIETAQGTVAVQNGKWKAKDAGEPLSRSPGHDGHLPPILSIIHRRSVRLDHQGRGQAHRHPGHRRQRQDHGGAASAGVALARGQLDGEGRKSVWSSCSIRRCRPTSRPTLPELQGERRSDPDLPPVVDEARQ